MLKLFGRVLCFLSFHDWVVVEATFGFGPAGTVEKIECRRCGLYTTRQSRR